MKQAHAAAIEMYVDKYVGQQEDGAVWYACISITH